MSKSICLPIGIEFENKSGTTYKVILANERDTCLISATLAQCPLYLFFSVAIDISRLEKGKYVWEQCSIATDRDQTPPITPWQHTSTGWQMVGFNGSMQSISPMIPSLRVGIFTNEWRKG